jgi:hypothetical protein
MLGQQYGEQQKEIEDRETEQPAGSRIRLATFCNLPNPNGEGDENDP